jgi:hypothetical protein
MNLKEYFEKITGLGILATADAEGNVDVAVYSRPHVADDETVMFIMADRLSHRNIQSNPKAAFLFREDGAGYHGTRIYLEKIKEEKNSPLIDRLRARKHGSDDVDAPKDRFLVYFKVTGTRPLTGDDVKGSGGS